METMKDRQFLAEAEKMKLEISPVPGENVRNLVAEIYRMPPEALRKVVEAMK